MTRPYEAVYPATGWSERITFSPGVKVGNMLFISGMTASDRDGNIIGEGDIVRQCEAIFEKMGVVLAAAGANFSNIVETTDYFVDLRDYEKTADIRRRFFGGPPYPAATGVRVAGLIRPGALIEIRAIAVLSA